MEEQEQEAKTTAVESPSTKTKTTDIRPGMTVRVHERIKDISAKGEERERIQLFEGIVLGLRGSGPSKSMVIRRVSKGFGVEKIYPLHTPTIAAVDIVKTAKVRRAKLSFLQDLRHPFKRKLKETRAKE